MPVRLALGFMIALALVLVGFGLMSVYPTCDVTPECPANSTQTTSMVLGLLTIWIAAPAALIGIPIILTKRSRSRD